MIFVCHRSASGGNSIRVQDLIGERRIKKVEIVSTRKAQRNSSKTSNPIFEGYRRSMVCYVYLEDYEFLRGVSLTVLIGIVGNYMPLL